MIFKAWLFLLVGDLALYNTMEDLATQPVILRSWHQG